MNAPHHLSSTPVLTVVTITFNLCKACRIETLRKCIDSVQSQSCASQIEHLIVDGASQDGTLELLADFERNGWITCISEPDTGIYNAMNKGIAKARGKYIVFMNSDDYFYESDIAEKSIELLEKTGASFSYGKARWIFEPDYAGWRPDSDLWVPTIGQFFMRMPFSHQSMIARTDVLRRYAGFDEGYRIVADYDLITRLLIGGERAVYLPRVIAGCRFGGLSTDMDFAALHQNERLKLRRTHYAPYIGQEEADKLDIGIIPPDLPIVLTALVHPSLVSYVTQAGQPTSDEMVSKLKAVLTNEIPNISRKTKQTKQTIRKVYRLFYFLPVILIKSRENDWSCCLFNFIPLLRVKTKDNVKRIRLFGFIPLFTTKTKGMITRTKLLSFIPILRLKTSVK